MQQRPTAGQPIPPDSDSSPERTASSHTLSATVCAAGGCSRSMAEGCRPLARIRSRAEMASRAEGKGARNVSKPAGFCERIYFACNKENVQWFRHIT